MEHCALTSTLDFIKQLPKNVELDDAICVAFMAESRMIRLDSEYSGEYAQPSLHSLKRHYSKDIIRWYGYKVNNLLDNLAEMLLSKVSGSTASIETFIGAIDNLQKQDHTNTSEAVNELSLAIMEARIQVNKLENVESTDSQRYNFFSNRETVMSYFNMSMYKHHHDLTTVNNDTLAWKVKVLELMINCIVGNDPLVPTLRPLKTKTIDKKRCITEFSALVLCQETVMDVIANVELCGLIKDIVSVKYAAA